MSRENVEIVGRAFEEAGPRGVTVQREAGEISITREWGAGDLVMARGPVR
jgi:hypothetical protein